MPWFYQWIPCLLCSWVSIKTCEVSVRLLVTAPVMRGPAGLMMGGNCDPRLWPLNLTCESRRRTSGQERLTTERRRINGTVTPGETSVWLISLTAVSYCSRCCFCLKTLIFEFCASKTHTHLKCSFLHLNILFQQVIGYLRKVKAYPIISNRISEIKFKLGKSKRIFLNIVGFFGQDGEGLPWQLDFWKNTLKAPFGMPLR